MTQEFKQYSRKKPETITAIQFDGTPESAAKIMQHWSGIEKGQNSAGLCLLIDTSDGTVACSVGEWIIQNEKGELHPCKADLFAALYHVLGEWTDTGSSNDAKATTRG